MQSLATLLHEITVETGESESQALARVIDAGVRALQRERVLAKLVREEISRSEAIAAVGLDWVLMTERQQQAIEEDIAWASRP
ncbi:uncharacterized protein SOCEGT47_062330 [Sorangium cellulosum]|uniref:Uncharacterized protein n=1 Tax=Sorangium cellulosum TaxID=56 RepID=A0A4P2Q802_SORCE|nr:hypothetical protein [Sorangium cellulosum]AUX25684.1 uncharacterized protein SOCEGT47_062330 [Sorangium cellulosum]